jgi:vanillate O-demethylase ferredoxin subunit
MREVTVSRRTHEAQGIVGVELLPVDGTPLPEFSAGAHVDVYLPSGICRQYSLTNAPDETHRYCLGIGLAENSRGGSRHFHEQLREGDRFQVGVPRALFGLEQAAPVHVFVAGGIGITPFLSMIEACEKAGQPWRLLYCVRTQARAAYLWRLAPYASRVTLHVDEEQSSLPDLPRFLGDGSVSAHVYCCGPAPLMAAVEQAAASAGVAPGSLHFERFAGDAVSDAAAPAGAKKAFRLTLRRTGRSLEVSPDQSMLEALEDHGIDHPYACREGLCRSCEAPLLAGRADHRDYVLSESEKAANACVILCVSRSLDDELVLDL